MSKKAKSPCIDVCKMDQKTGYCLGCFRTENEIDGWKKFSKDKRRGILKTLKTRAA